LRKLLVKALKLKKLKIYFSSQTGICPPKFTFRCNNKGLVHFSYERYLENTIRNNFDFTGTPITLQFKNRGSKEEDDKTEYIIINIGYFNEQGKRKYFVFTDRGTSLIDNGILIFDESIKYTTTDKKELDIYYTKDKNILAKQDKNDIYALEYKALEKNGVIEEYKYYIKKGKVEKDLINTYEGIKLVDNNSKK